MNRHVSAIARRLSLRSPQRLSPERLSVQITEDFGTGYSVQNLFSFKQFYLTYPNLIATTTALRAARGESLLSESPGKLHALSGESRAPGAPRGRAVSRPRVDALRQISEAAPRRSLAEFSRQDSAIQHAARVESWKPGQLHPSLSWTHYRTLLGVDVPEARTFYEIEANE